MLPHQLWLLTGPGCFQWAWKASPHFSQISNSVTQICQQQWATSLSTYPVLPHKVTLWGEQSSLFREIYHFTAAINSLLHYQVFKSRLHPLKTTYVCSCLYSLFFYLTIYGIFILNSRHVRTWAPIPGLCFDWDHPLRDNLSDLGLDAAIVRLKSGCSFDLYRLDAIEKTKVSV